MDDKSELKIRIAQEAAQSGVLKFLEEAEMDVVDRLIGMYSGGVFTTEQMIGQVGALAELRMLQRTVLGKIKEGAAAALRETGGQNG